jgi:hypothetical protein
MPTLRKRVQTETAKNKLQCRKSTVSKPKKNNLSMCRRANQRKTTKARASERTDQVRWQRGGGGANIDELLDPVDYRAALELDLAPKSTTAHMEARSPASAEGRIQFKLYLLECRLGVWAKGSGVGSPTSIGCCLVLV